MHKHIIRITLISVGWLSIVLGVIGIFLPLLPTTPFILLAAWCFAKSSTRFHQWLLSHPKLGPIVLTWENGEGLPRKVRNRILIVMWLGMSLSICIVWRMWATIMLISIGIAVTIYIMRKPVIEEGQTTTQSPQNSTEITKNCKNPV